MVRDIDMNPCALESWGLALSNAQELVTVRCTPAPLKFDGWSLWPFNFVQENAVNSGHNFRNFKISTFSNEYSGATRNRERYWYKSLCVWKLRPWTFTRTRIRIHTMHSLLSNRSWFVNIHTYPTPCASGEGRGQLQGAVGPSWSALCGLPTQCSPVLT